MEHLQCAVLHSKHYGLLLTKGPCSQEDYIFVKKDDKPAKENVITSGCSKCKWRGLNGWSCQGRAFWGDL